jgi:hypothetical protein
MYYRNGKMSIKIGIDETIRQSTSGNNLVEVEGNTIDECLDNLIELFPEVKHWIFGTNDILLALVSLNGTIIFQENLNTTVREGDNIKLTYMIGGG